MAGMTYDEVENLWIQAGGNPQSAAMAAAVADASSALNPDATQQNPDGTWSRGLWQISSANGALSSTDPKSNARAAILMSNNGSDWSQWCSTWSDNNCGLDHGTYLGEGANALASLAGKLGTGSYNVIGSRPASGGGSASQTVAQNASTPSGSNTSMILVVGAIILGIVIYYAQRRARQRPVAPPPSGPPRVVP